MTSKQKRIMESVILVLAFLTVVLLYWEGMCYLFDAWLSGACHEIQAAQLDCCLPERTNAR